eukprot:jgi/Bigna1/90940/estExt_fgenesh1_pg.C_830059
MEVETPTTRRDAESKSSPEADSKALENEGTQHRITEDFVSKFNKAFTDEIALKFRKTHADNCHHWDFTFLIWHRKFVNSFWKEVGLPRTYAVLTDEKDRELYASLQKSVWQDRNGIFRTYLDRNKLNQWEENDTLAMRRNIAEGFVSSSFALDLDFAGPRNGYNIGFSSQIEEFHDIVHMETGRCMRSVRTAGGDQCFFIHHTFVDLVFEAWLEKNKPDIPVDKAYFDSEPVFKTEYKDYDEFKALWGERHFTSDDYKHVNRIVMSVPATRTLLVFDEILHIEEARRVIVYHRGEELGRFSIITGAPETCESCKTKKHKGQFLLSKLVPLTELSFRINFEFFSEWSEAKEEFKKIGVSVPYVASF